MSEELVEVKEENVDDKTITTAEIVSPYVPYGVTTFAELREAKDAQVASQTVDELARQFGELSQNIFADGEIENKTAAINVVVGELDTLLSDAMSKEISDPLNNEEPDDSREDVLKAVWSTSKVNGFPDGSFLHILPGGKKNGDGRTVPRSLRMFPVKDAAGKVDLPHLRNALARIPQSNRISAATKKSLTTKARKMLKGQKKESDSLLDRIGDTVKSWFGEDEPEPLSSDFAIWKQADEPMRWAAWYSNNYRDDDSPAEIISADAHREFVKAIDDGEWPMPELWFWHVKGSRFGQTDLVAFAEDTGFTLAAGTIDKGKESIAEHCVGNGYKVSHGMPSQYVERDPDDPTVITRYRTKEVSFLPADAAANKFTAFTLKEDTMDLSEKKLEQLKVAGFDVEALLKGPQADAEAEDRESKEVEEGEVEAEAEVVTEVKAEVATETEAGEVAEAEPQTETTEEPVEASFTVDQMSTLADAFGQAMAPLMERLDTLETKMAEEPEEESEPEEKQVELPSDFLGKLLHSRVIGAEETRVDGRTKAAKDGPEETRPDGDGPVQLAHPLAESVINRVLTGATVRELQEAAEVAQ